MRELELERIISLIPELNECTLKKITKGYSFDLKYVSLMNGENVLLRLYAVSRYLPMERYLKKIFVIRSLPLSKGKTVRLHYLS